MPKCKHIYGKWVKGVGNFCVDCGKQTLAIEKRECQDCKHSRGPFLGWTCDKKLMNITPKMHVSYHVEEGTCWEPKESIL